MKQAKFTVICPKTSEIIISYDVQYADAKELHIKYNEGRKVWHEYHVTAETDAFVLGNSHTYEEQLYQSLKLSKMTANTTQNKIQ